MECKKIRSEFYSENHAIVYCFDLNNSQSFNNLENWFKECKQNGGEKLLPVLLGVKSDLKKEVTSDNINSITTKYKIQYFEVTSKFVDSVSKFYEDFANAIFEGLSKDKKK